MPRRARKAGPHSQDSCPLALSWMFKLVIDCGGHRELINDGCFNDDDIARELGIYWLVEPTPEADEEIDFPPAKPARRRRSKSASKPDFRDEALKALRHEHKLFNKAFPKPGLPDNLLENLEKLAHLVGLNQVEQKLIGFCSLMNTDTLLDDCCNALGYMGLNRLIRILSTGDFQGSCRVSVSRCL